MLYIPLGALLKSPAPSSESESLSDRGRHVTPQLKSTMAALFLSANFYISLHLLLVLEIRNHVGPHTTRGPGLGPGQEEPSA